MKKLFKSCFIALMAVVVSFACFTGCGEQSREKEQISTDESGQITNVSGSLNIRLWEGGFGKDYLNNVVKGFKAKYPKVSVSVNANTLRKVVFQEIVGTSSRAEYDVYISDSLLSDYAEQFEDLTDVLDYKWTNESKTIREKMDPLSVEIAQTKNNDKTYFLPTSVTPYGIAYNADLVDEDEIPVTSDEFIKLCKSLKQNSITPIIFSGDVDCNYWTFIYTTWYAQYQSVEEFRMAEVGKVRQADGSYVYDKSSAYLDGELKAMQLCEEILSPVNGYIYNRSTGTGFITAQIKFLDGEVAMMANGSWMLNEMQDLYPDGPAFKFRLMKVPVISDIKDRCDSIADDSELSALIRAIDSGSTALMGDGYDVNQADFDRVKEARSISYTLSSSYGAVIPKIAMNKTIAKLFLEYMYSDEGIEIVAKTGSGNFVPVTGYSYDNYYTGNDTESIFLSSCADLYENSQSFFDRYDKQAISQLCIDAGSVTIERQFGSLNASDRVSALDSYNNKKAMFTEQYFRDALYKFGYHID